MDECGSLGRNCLNHTLIGNFVISRIHWGPGGQTITCEQRPSFQSLSIVEMSQYKKMVLIIFYHLLMDLPRVQFIIIRVCSA